MGVAEVTTSTVPNTGRWDPGATQVLMALALGIKIEFAAHDVEAIRLALHSHPVLRKIPDVAAVKGDTTPHS